MPEGLIEPNFIPDLENRIFMISHDQRRYSPRYKLQFDAFECPKE